ncbi:hypothetical protein PsorP6_010138 [Peronosclerospora sorghi]|uniref:Uncharacterized protein n=1 Tax=Peronosclerospora sorghi TaxID=230839 RepID=A0ACC0VUX7_9STRA|nr:hypothetical protein PsorP6_010138 [Peronosclerospora sorghi]
MVGATQQEVVTKDPEVVKIGKTKKGPNAALSAVIWILLNPDFNAAEKSARSPDVREWKSCRWRTICEWVEDMADAYNMQREIPCNKFYRGAPVKLEEVYQSTSSIQETIYMLASLKCHVLLHVKAKVVKIEDQVTLHIG